MSVYRVALGTFILVSHPLHSNNNNKKCNKRVARIMSVRKKIVLFLAVVEDTHYMYIYTGHLIFRPLFMTARSWSGVASSLAPFTALQSCMLKRVYKIGKSGSRAWWGE